MGHRLLPRRRLIGSGVDRIRPGAPTSRQQGNQKHRRRTGSYVAPTTSRTWGHRRRVSGQFRRPRPFAAQRRRFGQDLTKWLPAPNNGDYRVRATSPWREPRQRSSDPAGNRHRKEDRLRGSEISIRARVSGSASRERSAARDGPGLPVGCPRITIRPDSAALCPPSPPRIPGRPAGECVTGTDLHRELVSRRVPGRDVRAGYEATAT